MKRLIRPFSLAALSLVLCAVLPGAALPAEAEKAEKKDAYVFGVVPQFEQRKLYAIWKPIIDELQKKTGLSFDLVTTLQIRAFDREFEDGKFDFVYMNPYYMLKTTPPNDYLPLVRDATPLRGVVVVKKDGPLKTPADLAGKTVAFPSPNAIGATLLVRADLERLHGVKVEPLYVKTHSSVYLNVVKDVTPAGGGVEKTLQSQPPEVRDALRVIFTTRPFPSHPVAAHPRVPSRHREAVRRALLDLNASPEGKELLSKVPVKEFVATSKDDYEPMRAWRLDAYWDDTWKEE